jgi:alkylated DNA repair dioxygenase AlkB
MGPFQIENNLLPFGGEVYYNPHFLEENDARRYFGELRSTIIWKEESVRIFGKNVLQPRLTAWYGDPGTQYTYSGLTMHPVPWTPALSDLKKKIESATGFRFNSALLNLYRNGRDSMGWHRDNEAALGVQPVIASLSLGETRTFQLRDHHTKKKKISVGLQNGSLLIMKGETQTHWQHALPKTSNEIGERINITFRRIFST